ncbi:MAG: hypothetical protein M3132_15070 [Actinomycetia bacterium]|nr:hypothetical protein [Actinomycetes bacterium]
MTGRADPEGKRALFESPPIEIEDPLRDDPLVDHHEAEGHEALYSAGPREAGTTLLTCSECKVRSRISVVETVVRIMTISLWDPRRSYTRWMQCPSCQTRTWCKIEWLG